VVKNENENDEKSVPVAVKDRKERRQRRRWVAGQWVIGGVKSGLWWQDSLVVAVRSNSTRQGTPTSATP
jgi:hypothetical protein